MELEGRIKNYWEGEATSYSSSINNELVSEERQIWKELIYSHILSYSSDTKLKVLDMGTGPGFFPIILGEDGHDVTGIDITENMLECARENAAREGVKATFKRMNCQQLDFPDNTFDLLICRNVTWILENPKETYTEWHRVLKPGGYLLIFDANWNGYLFDDDLKERHFKLQEESRKRFGQVTHEHCDMEETEAISKKLPMGRHNRPLWDLDTLMSIGFSNIFSEININDKVCDERQKLEFSLSPIFLVGGKK